MKKTITIYALYLLLFPVLLAANEPNYSGSLWSNLFDKFNVAPFPTFWNRYTDSVKKPILETFIQYNNIINTRYQDNMLKLGNIAYGVSASNPIRINKRNYGSIEISYSSILSSNKWRFKNKSDYLAYHDDVNNYKIGYTNNIWKTLEIEASLGFINTEKQNMMYTGLNVGYQWPHVKVKAGYDQSNTVQYAEFKYDNVTVYAPVKLRFHTYNYETYWKTNDVITIFSAGNYNFSESNRYSKNRFLTSPDIENYNFENRLLYQNGIWSSELLVLISKTPSLARLSKGEIPFGTLKFPGLNHNMFDWSFGFSPIRFFKLSAGYSYIYGNSDMDLTVESWPFAPSVIDILEATYHSRLDLDYNVNTVYCGGLVKVNAMNQLQFGAKLMMPSFHGTASYKQLEVGDVVIDVGERTLEKKVTLLSTGLTLKTGYKTFGVEMSYNKIMPISLLKKDHITNQKFRILNGGDFIRFYLRFYL